MSAHDDIDKQKLWIGLQRRSWQVLAVVPTTDDEKSLEAANAIADVAWRYRGQPSVVVDLRDVTLRLVDYHKREIDAHVERGETVVLALSAIGRNPSTIPVARGADCAVLLVRLGQSATSAAKTTVEEIGHDKFVGTILVQDGAPSTREPSDTGGAAP